jgi:homoserine dehydrogenase
MEKLIIQIGASLDYYGGFAENCTGVYGAGASVTAAGVFSDIISIANIR